jgi:hypothetical protein
MRTIIAGSRNCNDYHLLLDAIDECSWTPTVIISGSARGVDTMGEDWAFDHKIPCEKYPADWNKYGKSAGYKRNVLMAEKAEALIVLWDGVSKGTGHMIDIAQRKGLAVFIKYV